MSRDNSKMRRAGKSSVDIKRNATFAEKAYTEGDFKNTLRTQVRVGEGAPLSALVVGEGLRPA